MHYVHIMLESHWFPPSQLVSEYFGSFRWERFPMYGILNSLPIELEGKTINLEVEVVEANLNYNLLLG